MDPKPANDDILPSPLDPAEVVVSGDDRPLVGEAFGNYVLVGELAVGGMAEIYLAVQQGPAGFTKVVTLKRVLPHLTKTPEFVEMFTDEARLAARLDHPNIVRTHEFGNQDGKYFTVMEYLAGEDLSVIIERANATNQQLPIHMVAGIIARACEGLQFAHELTETGGKPLGLVHRDLNPSNMIVTYGGEVKVIDFGVAKTSSKVAQTAAGTIKGKLAYMAPEQILARSVDARSDIFSLGAVLYEMLTGKALFARANEAATLYAVMNDLIPAVSASRSDVPPKLDEIVARCLVRKPEGRYASADALRAALVAFLDAQPKCDARFLARAMQSLFGSSRAEAKRSIAQSRSLSKNIALVMKLRDDTGEGSQRVVTGVSLNEISGAYDRVPPRANTAPPAMQPRKLPLKSVVLVLALIATALSVVLVLGSKDTENVVQAHEPSPQATLVIESTPPGAAVFVNNEPTGLRTPARLTGVAPGPVLVRIELPGHLPITDNFTVAASETASRSLELRRMTGRLVLSGLPREAVVFVDGAEYAAGEAITVDAGRHEVLIVKAGQTITQESIETSAGDQVWDLNVDRLIRK